MTRKHNTMPIEQDARFNKRTIFTHLKPKINE
jgi:hypothetical protein